MQIQLKNAVDHFYSNHSLDLVFLEAVANSIDAGSTDITIDVIIESFKRPNSLTLKFKDNGCGFTERNFEKFSRLLDVDEADHKGVGRLVYLQYFGSVKVSSIFENNYKREFLFNLDFNEDSSRVEKLVEKEENITILTFTDFLNRKINSYRQLLPEKIKENIMDSFLPIFFQKKAANESLTIQINLITSEHIEDRGFYNKTSVLTLDDIPELSKREFVLNEIDFTAPFVIYYKIEASEHKKLTTKICVDGRAIPLNILSLDSIPGKYQVIILVTSDILKGRTNASRQRLELPENLSEASLNRALAPQIADILSENIPSIEASNSKVYHEVDQKYPHLAGLYDRNKSIGLVSENDVIEESQKLFFKRQKYLLDKQNKLSYHDYYTALEFASRSLTEYVLYRKLIIDQIKDLDKTLDEKSIHELIVPRRRIYRNAQPYDQYFSNNVWLLDDKFMSYDTVLSERTMDELLSEFAEEKSAKGKDRPDIALIFSGQPEHCKGIEIVIVELKKYSIKLEKQEEVESQLRKRARVLLKHYPNKIERMWYYGITEMTDEFIISLKEKHYKPLFSKGKAFYNQIDVMEEGTATLHPIDVSIMDYETFIRDAEARNSAFFDFLKKRVKSFVGI